MASLMLRAALVSLRNPDERQEVLQRLSTTPLSFRKEARRTSLPVESRHLAAKIARQTQSHRIALLPQVYSALSYSLLMDCILCAEGSGDALRDDIDVMRSMLSRAAVEVRPNRDLETLSPTVEFTLRLFLNLDVIPRQIAA